jgi:hypothetical protein
MAQEILTRQHLTVLAGICSVAILFGIFSAVLVFRLRRKRRLSNLEPPESLSVVRGPGESLRLHAEQLMERAMQTLLFGSPIAILGLCFPVILLNFWPTLNPLSLLASGIALFAAVSIFISHRAFQMLEERNRKKLGWYGERLVAEVLNRKAIEGAAYFHDVPITQNGFITNIDHLVLTPNAAVVIETKMRSKPKDPGEQKVQVVFDGEKLEWPRFKNDTKTLNQARRNADWTSRVITQLTGRSLAVHSVVAIPGWQVIEKQLGSLRVVSGNGVTDAIRQLLSTSAAQPPLTSSQFTQVVEHFEQLCRDTEI